MGSNTYSNECLLSRLEIYEEKGSPLSGLLSRDIYLQFMKKVLRNMDDEGNYSIDNGNRSGVVEGIVFYQKHREETLEYSPSEFIDLSRPLKFKRTIEDELIEEV